MANFICLIRTDIPEGVLQVLDLSPNTSLKNLVYDPQGQTRYVSFRAQNDTIALSGAGPIVTDAAYNGLAAYLVDRVENTGGGAIALTAAEANSIATAIIAAMDAGTAQTLAAINVLINVPAGVSGSDLDGTLGNSTGTVEDILSILAGEVYTVPAATEVETVGNAFVAAVAGSFATTERVRDVYQSGFFEISRLAGQLAGYKSANFEYLGTTGAAVVVYDADGNVL